MSRMLVRLCAASLALSLGAAPLSAQQVPSQLPSPEQAQQLLESRPDLVAQLRQRLQASGMTADQIRARLRAEGYPENLLDAYLGAGTSGTTPTDSVPNAGVFDAVRALGIVDSAGLDSLRNLRSDMFRYQGQQVRAAVRDEVVCDSVLVDSVPVATPQQQGDSIWIDSLQKAQQQRRRPISQLLCRPRQRFAPTDSGFQIFGLDVFANRETTQFDANLAGSVDQNYRIGPGDRLVLILTGDVEVAYRLDVTREGFIVIPQVGRLDVANLTLSQLEDLLYTRLHRVYSGVKRGPGATTHFSVSVARLRTNQVYVTGDVDTPGSYRVSSAGTAMTALYAAGGPSRNGSLRRIEIRRGGRLVDTLDVYDYLLHGDASHDVRLESGDVVFVPVHGPRVRVVGEVLRPATYELKGTETLADLIRSAGGFAPTASHRRIQIERILPAEQRTADGRDRVVIDINSTQGLVRSDGADGVPAGIQLAAGDVVRVFPVADRVRNRIAVLGDVWSPGPQGFTPGMKLSDAIRHAGGVKPDVYAGQVLITRLQPDSTRVQLRASFRDSVGTPAVDVPLQEDDEIRVFSKAEFRPQRYVSIAGAVRKSGRVPYREGMTMRDLVLMAGGVEESAYLNEAEIARLPENRADGVTAKTIRVPLDSSYLFERGPDGKYLGPPGLPAPRGTAPDVPLKPYDNVLILRQPNWELQRTVAVGGEVKFPGRYTLLTKKERLSEVIKRAGGFTTAAYPGGVVFVRREGNVGRIGVDLAKVVKDPRFRDNLILQDGDSVFIPAFSGVVTVQGAVNAPEAVAYVPGANLDYYVRAAGGENRKADMKRAYVRQPNGKVQSVHRRFLLPDGVPKPGAGSVVVVPEREPGQSQLLAALPIVAQITASLVAIVAVLRR